MPIALIAVCALFAAAPLAAADSATTPLDDLLVGNAYEKAQDPLWRSADPEPSRRLITELNPLRTTGTKSGAPFTLLWPNLAADHHRYTADDQILTDALWQGLELLFNDLTSHETPANEVLSKEPEENDGSYHPMPLEVYANYGLLSFPGTADTFINWPEALREGFDYEYARERENAVLNAFYYRALNDAAYLMDAMGRNGAYLRGKAALVRRAYANRLRDEESGLVRDAPGSMVTSLQTNVIAACFGLLDESGYDPLLDLIRAHRLNGHPFLAPWVVQAAFVAGDAKLAYSLLAAKEEHPWKITPRRLIVGHLMGLTPSAPGWREVTFAPNLPNGMRALNVKVPLLDGHLSAHFDPATGYSLTVPPSTQVHLHSQEGDTIVVKNALSHAKAPLTTSQRQTLDASGWAERVGDSTAVWIDADEQILRVIQRDEVLMQARCSTAANGIGSQANSLKTPTGWHSIAGKVGDNAPRGQVFRVRRPTAEIWQPGDDTTEDLVLTRILLLTGEELGKNKGGNVDSWARNIYIHGTNDEARIGTPTSHGCIRLTNDDVITAFKIIPENAPVLITATPTE